MMNLILGNGWYLTGCVDVSFFGHLEFNGVRIETGYQISEKGAIPFSSKKEYIATAKSNILNYRKSLEITNV